MKEYGHKDPNLAFVYSYIVREYFLDPLKEDGVDSQLIEYAKKVAIFPTFLNSINRTLWNFFRSKLYTN